MNADNVLQQLFEDARRDGRLTPTGRSGIRDTFAGEVVYAEYALPNGATLWHGKGVSDHVPANEHYQEVLAELPEEWLLGEPADVPEPTGELVEPFGNWRAPRGSLSSDRNETIYYDRQGKAYRYPYANTYYCYTRKFRRARGCNCAARYDKSIECECGPDHFEDVRIVKWLRRVKGGWEELSEPPDGLF